MSTLKSNKETATAASLRALLSEFIDYAGLFPPAKLPLNDALENYGNYAAGNHAWMLRWFVLPVADVASASGKYAGKLSVLAGDSAPAADVTARAAAIETTAPLATNDSGKPVYCQIAPDRLDLLDRVQTSGCFAKIRMGGLNAADFPAADQVARFIVACAERRLPFKATAGLHHPVRANYRLTYDAHSAKAPMYGFINVLMAAALAWNGERDIEAVLVETDTAAFEFTDAAASWRGQPLSVEQLRAAREEFVHAVGSCSFEEPVNELRQLGWIS